MEDLNRTTYFYRKKFRSKLEKFNHGRVLPDYFSSMIGNKKEIVIAELGAGPINTIGDSWPGVDVKIYASDVLQPEYEKSWQYYNAIPIVPVEYQDFEHLTYPDEFFDIVHCVNALDHTGDPRQALEEIYRVCKPGGWIYLRHAPDQMKRYGGMHRWDAKIINGKCVFQGKTEIVIVEGAKVHLEDDLIIAIWQKT